MKNVLRRSAQALASRRSVGLLLLAILLLIRVWDPRPLEELRLRSFDFFQTTSPRDSAVRPVVIVDIDESSLIAFGQWPWPRTILADLLTRLYEWQAAAIAFDVIFPEPDRSSLNEAVKHFRDLDDDTRGRLLHLPSNDDVFAQAIGRGNVVLGQAGVNAIHPRSREKPPKRVLPPSVPIPGRILLHSLISCEIFPSWNRRLSATGSSASAQNGMEWYAGCRS
jgi:adenylate cyclase